MLPFTSPPHSTARCSRYSPYSSSSADETIPDVPRLFMCVTEVVTRLVTLPCPCKNCPSLVGLVAVARPIALVAVGSRRRLLVVSACLAARHTGFGVPHAMPLLVVLARSTTTVHSLTPACGTIEA